MYKKNKETITNKELIPTYHKNNINTRRFYPK